MRNRKTNKVLGMIGWLVGVLLLVSCGTSIESKDTGSSAASESVSDNIKETIVESATVTEESTVEESEPEAESTTNEKSSEEITTVEETTTESAGKTTEESNEIAEMQVHFIDVGQGDATLIICDGEAMLIDAGDNTKGTKIQSYMSKQGVKTLKYLVLTHPDADHIGAADVIVTKFDIENIFMSDYTKDNQTYNEVILALNNKSYKWSAPEVGSTYTLGSATFTIIAPNKQYSDPNNASLGLVLQNGDNKFLFTGDAEEESETDILANGISIECDVYKAGHHGSNTANSKALLDAATPAFVVISCTEGNSYGHPHAEPMNNFRSMGMKLFRTDEQGSVIATSDGTEITWNCAPTESWKAGESTESSSKNTGTKESTMVSEPELTPEQAPEPEPVVEEPVVEEPVAEQPAQNEYVIGNKNTKAFHRPTCSRLPKPKNQVIFNNREEALAAGYDNPCDYCCP